MGRDWAVRADRGAEKRRRRRDEKGGRGEAQRDMERL